MKTIITLLLAVLMSGCSAYGVWYGETKPMMTFAELTTEDEEGAEESSKLFVWSPKNSAAFVNSKGHSCVQGAEVFHEKSGELDVGAELIGVLKGLDLSSSKSGNDKALALKITNEIVSLRTNSERNTYLSIGMFGLCQLHQSGGISQTELQELVLKLFASTLKINTPAVAPPAVAPPAAGQ